MSYTITKIISYFGFMTATLMAVSDETFRDLFYEELGYDEADISEFNLTSRGTEEFHEKMRLGLIESAKRIKIECDPSHTEEDLVNLRFYMKQARENAAVFWEEFYDGVPDGSVLYYVGFRGVDNPYSAYVIFKDGHIFKKKIYN